MGWAIMGMIMWFVFFRRKSYHCRNRQKTQASRCRQSSKSASESYRLQAEAEDMSRRILAMERALDPRDDRLHREFQNL